MHFEKFLGHDVEIKFFKPVDGVKETEGTLKAFENDEISVDTAVGSIKFNKKDAAYVRLKIEF